MFRPASRLFLRSAPRLQRAGNARRFLSTAPPAEKRRSWKSSAFRWGLAAAGIYYYNTSNVFAEEPQYAVAAIPETDRETESLPTVDAIAAQRQQQRSQSLASTNPSSSPQQSTAVGTTDGAPASPGSPGELEEEADQQGAFNPETGEINWDCPCLGGMAHGPCGEQFKAAFSCFVYSKEEPKGMDCIDRFKDMQNCFREHPDVYGSELEDEQDDVSAETQETAGATAKETAAASSETKPDAPAKVAHLEPATPSPEHEVAERKERAKQATTQVKSQHQPHDEADEVVPKAWHDTTSTNEGK